MSLSFLLCPSSSILLGVQRTLPILVASVESNNLFVVAWNTLDPALDHGLWKFIPHMSPTAFGSLSSLGGAFESGFSLHIEPGWLNGIEV